MEYALVARWLAAYLVLAAAGVPIAARLFPRFAGRGVGLALPVALVVATTAVYWVGHLTFGPVALAAGVLALVAASLAAGLDREALRNRRLALAPAADVDRRRAAETLAVFVAAFLLVVAIRAVDPAVDPNAGEKFLDFGLLKSLGRATALPPEDMWFANEPVRYYYGGHLVATVLARLTWTPPRFAYNLALAGFYAMLVTAAFDLARAVATRRVRTGVRGGTDDASGGGGAGRESAHEATAGGDAAGAGAGLRAGLAAAFLVGLASNLAPAWRLAVGAVPAQYRRGVARAVAERTAYSVDALLAGSGFSYWSASRVIPGTINEFPLFAWLNGDLHAHMMGTPFLVLATALAYSYYLTPESARRRRLALVAGAVPLVGGLQAVVDTWSFPSVFGVLWLAMTFAPAHPATLLPTRLVDGVRSLAGRAGLRGRLAAELGRAAAALVVAGVAAGLAVVLALPFFLGAASGREVALLPAAERSGFAGLALVHGGFLAAFAVYLLGRLRPERVLPLALAGVAVVAVAFARDLAVLALVVPLGVLGWVALRTGRGDRGDGGSRADRPDPSDRADRTDRPRGVGFETVLVVAGAGLVTLVELLYVKEQAGPLRMNTVFKTYMQVWVLWGIAGGVVLAALWDGWAGAGVPAVSRAVDRLPSTVDRYAGGVAPVSAAGSRRTLARGFVLLLVVSTSMYGALALDNHFARPGDPTLDATAFVEARHPAEAPAIRWLDAREGRPTLLSAPGTTYYPAGGGDPRGRVMYGWSANPASSLTGVPTVAGWGHEVGYRGAETYHARVRHVDEMYTAGPERRAELLRAYGVEYVWVGPSERARYGDGVGSTFEDMAGLTVAFDRGSVTVYRVDEDRLIRTAVVH